jgi:hypothetical protein
MFGLFNILNTIVRGWKYDKETDAMVFVEPVGEDEEGDELRTFKILQEIANSICPQIQMTIDVTGAHRNKKLPVLDLNLWMSTDGFGRQRLCHTFYKKEVSSRYTILKRSAISMSVKRTTHFQEAIRRLKGCDKSQTWLERASHLTEWSNMLRISGYNELYRYSVMVGAIDRYNEIVKMEKDGVIDNLYRSREQVVNDCVKRGGKSAAATWFMKGDVTSTLCTAPTPNSELRDQIVKKLTGVVTADGTKTKVIEVGGVPISIGIKKADPFQKTGCMFGDPECIVEEKTSCGVMSACYQILCSCGDPAPVTDTDSEAQDTTGVARTPNGRDRARVVAGRRRNQGNRAGGNRRQEGRKKEGKISNERKNYLGITGRSLHMRMTEHLDAVKRGDMKYALARHMAEAHNDDPSPPKFKMKLISRHKSNLEKAVTEGILIVKQDQEYLLNKKNEWGQNRGLIRLTAGRV